MYWSGFTSEWCCQLFPREFNFQFCNFQSEDWINIVAVCRPGVLPLLQLRNQIQSFESCAYASLTLIWHLRYAAGLILGTFKLSPVSCCVFISLTQLWLVVKVQRVHILPTFVTRPASYLTPTCTTWQCRLDLKGGRGDISYPEN